MAARPRFSSTERFWSFHSSVYLFQPKSNPFWKSPRNVDSLVMSIMMRILRIAKRAVIWRRSVVLMVSGLLMAARPSGKDANA